MSLTFTQDIKYLKSRLSYNKNSADKTKLAKYYLNNGEAKKAIELCKESLEIYPNYLTTYLILANSYISESDFSAAQETLKKADKYFPNHWSFDSIKKIVWQSDLGVNKNRAFEEVHKSILLADDSDEPEMTDMEDMLDPIVSMQKFSFNFDDYTPKQTESSNDLLNSEDDQITLNHFRPTAADFIFDDDDIVKSLLNEGEMDAILMPREIWGVDIKKLYPGYNELLDDEDIQSEPIAPLTPIKSDNPDKIVFENELTELLGIDNLEFEKNVAIKNLSNIDDDPIKEKKPNSPPLVSKTMADVYISQGKYTEAISIYSELLKKKEITTQEYDTSMKTLQEKMSPPDIDI
jgi:tetratricopeptide (TPR) repeat protein